MRSFPSTSIVKRWATVMSRLRLIFMQRTYVKSSSALWCMGLNEPRKIWLKIAKSVVRWKPSAYFSQRKLLLSRRQMAPTRESSQMIKSPQLRVKTTSLQSRNSPITRTSSALKSSIYGKCRSLTLTCNSTTSKMRKRSAFGTCKRS